MLTLTLGVMACSGSARHGSADAPSAVGAARGPATGTVTVTAGNKVVCVMTLTAGRGSCKVNTADYAPGSLRFKAAYSGGAGFKPSHSSASVQLLRASSTTRLALSAGSVTYVDEQAERLSVRVAPQFSGTPAGQVTVRAGNSVVCVFSLASADGSCTLSAKKLVPGSYHLAASYAGNAEFASSTSPSQTLVVVAG